MAVTGWPRKLRWDQFRKLDSRPQGQSTDAHTEAQWMNPPGKKFKLVRDRRAWRLDNVNLVLTLVNQETWVVKGKESDELLKHEQGHWDIAGLLVREYHRQLVALRARTPAKLTELFKNTEKRAKTRLSQVNKQYEDDTKHGTDSTQQKKWNELITKSKTGRGSLP